MTNPSVYLLLFLLCFFTSFFLLIMIIPVLRRRRIEQRLMNYLPNKTNTVDDEPEHNDGKYKSILMYIGKLFNKVSFVHKWESKLQVAGISLKPEEFYALRWLFVGVCFGTIKLLGYGSMIAFVSIPISYLLPSVYIAFKKRKRLSLCSHQLGEVLGTMANSLRAGFSFMQAMQLVSEDVPDPIGTEFKKTLTDISYGVSVEEAFTRLVKRLPNPDLELVVSALLIQRTSGGNLAELLETTQETIKGRVRLKEELKTLMAQGKISGIIITLLPIALGFYFYKVNHEFFEPILIHPIGWILLGIGGFSCLIGWLFIQKIIKIEV